MEKRWSGQGWSAGCRYVGASLRYKNKYTNLGKRGGGKIAKLMEEYPIERWEKRVFNAVKETKRLAKEEATERITEWARRFSSNYKMEQKAVTTANAYYEKQVNVTEEDLDRKSVV